MNPISRLAQIQQAKKEKEPEYVLLTERGLPRRREFVMQVGWCSCGQPFPNHISPWWSILYQHILSVRPCCSSLGLEMHAFNLSTLQAGGSEFEAGLVYTARPYLKNQTETKARK